MDLFPKRIYEKVFVKIVGILFHCDIKNYKTM